MTENWQTIDAHSASGLRLQEWEGKARVIMNGDELVSPSTDTDSVYAQYRARFNRWLKQDGHPDYQGEK